MNTLKESSKQESLSQNLSIEIRGVALWAVKVFKFFASLGLAITLLIILMGVLAAGTFIESAHGTDAARILIYQSPWFSLLLFLLGVNLATAALDRLPWKMKHIGFVVTHVGIIIILFGSYITQKKMIDGQFTLAEGETEDHVTLTQPLLYVFSQSQGTHWFFNVKKHAFPWTGEQILPKTFEGTPIPFQLKVLADYPKAAMNAEVKAADQGAPAVKIKLHNSFVDQEQWLLKGDSDLGQIQMGPAVLKFGEELLKEEQSENLPEKGSGYLEFQFGDKIAKLLLNPELKLPATLPVEGTEFKVELLRMFRNAVVNGKELAEGPNPGVGIGKNPAVEFMLLGSWGSEKHTAFANFPEFPTMHGMRASQSGAKIFFRRAGGGSRGEKHEIYFVVKDGKLFCQTVQGLKVTTHEVKINEEIATGWMGGLTVTAQEFYPRASVEYSFAPVGNLSENPEDLPAMKIEISSGEKSKTLWLRQGTREEFELAGESLMLAYTLKRLPVPFKLQLKDFRLETYPGTDRPASFESDVVLKDDSRGVVRTQTISMNQPLVYRGYRIYQSGYSQTPDSPEISVFSVGQDPGVPINYLGAIVLVSGIAIMFFTRRFSTAGRTL